MQANQHGDRHQQDHQIRDDVQIRVGEEEGLEVDAMAFDQGVPVFGNGLAFEDLGEDDGHHVADDDKENGEDLEAEFPVGIDAEVEDEDGGFGEADRGRVDHVGGGCPLFER